MSFENEKITIMVIGIDRKKHLDEPHKNTCLCGVKILNKNIKGKDNNLFSCYECTY
jgi:hypothetical protein